jgi:hypothetical protein
MVPMAAVAAAVCLQHAMAGVVSLWMPSRVHVVVVCLYIRAIPVYTQEQLPVSGTGAPAGACWLLLVPAGQSSAPKRTACDNLAGYPAQCLLPCPWTTGRAHLCQVLCAICQDQGCLVAGCTSRKPVKYISATELIISAICSALWSLLLRVCLSRMSAWGADLVPLRQGGLQRTSSPINRQFQLSQR